MIRLLKEQLLMAGLKAIPIRMMPVQQHRLKPILNAKNWVETMPLVLLVHRPRSQVVPGNARYLVAAAGNDVRPHLIRSLTDKLMAIPSKWLLL